MTIAAAIKRLHPGSFRGRPPCDHRTPYWTAAPRCTGPHCGHRQAAAPGQPPRQTRELPAVLWPFEIAGRIEARVRGWLARAGRLPL
jgi:hypothetical protein